MKNSGIEWIGEIPDGWEMIPNKHLFLDHSQKVGEKWTNYKLLSLTTSGVKEKDINSTGGKIPDSYENYQTVVPGDMVFCLFDLDCSAVFSGLSAHSGMITSAYDVFAVNDNLIDEKYIDYWFQYVFSNRYYKMYSKNIRYTVTGETFGATLTPVPPIKTQRKIGVFLKNKCAEVDKLIDIQQAQIDKLKEYKQSVITEAVTKGLDPTVPMKDSGVEWIGMIPCEWEIRRGKNVVDLLNKPVYNTDDVITCFRDGEVTLRKNRREEGFTFSDKEIGYQGIDVGDLVIHGMDGFAGAIGISDSRGKGSPVLIVLDSKQNKKFLMYYLRSLAYRDIFLALSTGIRVRSCDLRWNKISTLPFLIPSLEEQGGIVKYIEKRLYDIDKLIAIKQAKIDKLQEYKKSLIYEYVTGKKEVM